MFGQLVLRYPDYPIFLGLTRVSMNSGRVDPRIWLQDPVVSQLSLLESILRTRWNQTMVCVAQTSFSGPFTPSVDHFWGLGMAVTHGKEWRRRRRLHKTSYRCEKEHRPRSPSNVTRHSALMHLMFYTLANTPFRWVTASN